MNMRNTLPAIALLLATLVAAPVATAETREEMTLKSAGVVLSEMQRMPDLRAPNWLLARAEGIVVLPQVIKFGLGVGGRFGTGAMLLRDREGRWSNPVFVSLSAGSIGWQAGGQAADIVLVFTTRKSIEGLTGGKLTLGADASVAAGPVGRAASAATSPLFDAEIYSFSRTRGLFAGVSVEGSVLAISHKSNAAFYRKPGVMASDILDPTAPTAPQPAPELMAQVTAIVDAARAEAAAQPPATPAAGTTPAPAQPAAPEAETFPMNDDAGSPPKPQG